MNANSPEEWYSQMPIITKVFTTGTFATTVLGTFKVISIHNLILDWILVTKKLQLWRLFTDYFYIGRFSLSWIFQIYFLTTFSSKLETNAKFTSKSRGSYLYFIVVQMMTLNIVSLLLNYPVGSPIMGPSLHFSIIYVWSRYDPYAPVSLWGFTLQAYQLPFALLVLNLLMGGSLWSDLMGIFTGHLFYFLTEMLPSQGGVDILKRFPCPGVLDRFVYQLEDFSPIRLYKKWTTPRIQTDNSRSESTSGRILERESDRTDSTVLFRGVGRRLGGD